MSVCWRRTVLLLVFIIAVLQIIHMTLLSHLEAIKLNNAKQAKFTSSVNAYKRKEIGDDREKMLLSIRDSSILDSSGEYRIINNLMKANSLSPRNFIRNDITMITQSSVYRLNYLLTLMKRWHGLLSIAVFTLQEDISLTIELILLLRQCSPYIRFNTSFHLVYPLRSSFFSSSSSSPSSATFSFASSMKENDENTIDWKMFNLSNDLSELRCDDINNIFSSIRMNSGYTINYNNGGIEYPNNLLRNVARRNSLSKYILVIDIDLLPSIQLRDQFMNFVDRNHVQSDEKIVYVLPAYEIDESQNNFSNTHRSGNDIDDGIDIPEDKTSLLNLIEANKARPFYFELCWKCHKYTDYDAWQNEPISLTLNVIFEVLWKDPWEPFYLSQNTVPFYDERFRQYGFNRISQVCETHLAGYKFSVLNNGFLIHRGLKKMNSFHKEKDLELERNRQLFRQFKNELKDKYPHTSRRCY